MSAVLPRFWSQPIKYLRWASREKPALFYSIVIGSLGPISLVVTPPFRRLIGDDDPARIPVTYPIPAGPRKIPEGYDD